MKRLRESGASYRKKKKQREESLKKDEGSMLKFLNPKDPTEDTTVAGPSTSSIPTCAESDIVEKNVSKSDIEESKSDYSNSDTSDSDSSRHGDFEDVTPSINWKDIGTWPSEIEDQTRIMLIKQGSEAIQNINFNFNEGVKRKGASSKGQERHLSKDWFFHTLPNGENILRSWMIYSPSKKSLFCFCCKLFVNKRDKNALSLNFVEGFNTWWKLNPKVAKHENSPIHKTNVTNWKDLEMGLLQSATIDSKEQEQIKNQERRWKDILVRLFDIVRFLAKQNLPFRGHREDIEQLDGTGSSENKGNFLELVEFLAKYDPVLREHLTRVQLMGKHTISYLSPTIQNEFILKLGDKVRENIINRVKEAKYFSIIFDSTPDVSHKDETSQVYRYVVIDDCEVKVVESFVDFIETKGKKTEEITTMILSKIEADGLNIQNCRGQAYDNAAVMSGVHHGVQQRIKQVNPKAEYVACTNHSLNLVGVHAASVAIHSVTFFGVIERIFVYFSSSTHRWDILKSLTNKSVKRLVETRWSARADAVQMVKEQFTELVNALETLSGEERMLKQEQMRE